MEVIELNINVQFHCRLYFVMFKQGIEALENSDLHFKPFNDLIEHL